MRLNPGIKLKYGLIRVDDHVQETPDGWTSGLSKSKWGDRIPRIESDSNGAERWMFVGQPLGLPGVAIANAALPDRTCKARRWDEVPPSVYVPAERLKAM